MATVISKIDTSSKEFAANVAAMEKHIDNLNQHIERIKQGGSIKAQEREHARGKLLVRERINQLIDDNTEFHELSIMAGFQLYEDSLPAGGLVTGIGYVEGTACMIIANDATVKGGSYYPITAKKHLRAQQIAEKNQLPCVYIVDSGGAFLPKQDEVFADKDHFGRIFFNQARMSSQGIPQIAIVMGSCTAGGAYIPSMADVSIMVKKQARIFLAGPHLVKAATGENVSAEDLGGADLHCRHSGVSDYYANDDKHALQIARKAITNLNQQPTKKELTVTPPTLPNQNLLGCIHTDSRMPIEIREIIGCITDQSDFDEFKELFGVTLVCGFARIQGHLVGIVANNGVLFSDSALKGTQFIQLCNQRNIPLVFLQNITGFMVGKKYEANGIAKHGAKMVNAVACSTVPKITIIIGGSYGAGNYAMCGRAYEPDFLYMWPNAKISIMGGTQAANVQIQIKQAKAKKMGQDWDTQSEQKFRKVVEAQYEYSSHAYYSSARLWDDGIINPLDTRSIIGFNLGVIKHSHKKKQTHYGVFRM